MSHSDDYDLRSVLYGPFTRAGAPAREQQVTMFSTDNSIISTAAGDFNGDGIDDLCTFYAYEEHAEGGKLWLGTAHGLSANSTPLPSAAATAVGDFDKDGKADLATRVIPNGITENLPYDSRQRQDLLRLGVRPEHHPDEDHHAEHRGRARSQ